MLPSRTSTTSPPTRPFPPAFATWRACRAALLLVDHGSFADVSSRVESLTSDTNPLRHSAREALGLAAWKEGKKADAMKLFDQIASDDGAPRNTRERATLMSELIRGSGTRRRRNAAVLDDMQDCRAG